MSGLQNSIDRIEILRTRLARYRCPLARVSHSIACTPSLVPFSFSLLSLYPCPGNSRPSFPLLCSRTSFSGGAVSSREESRAISWRDLPSYHRAFGAPQERPRARGTQHAWKDSIPPATPISAAESIFRTKAAQLMSLPGRKDVSCSSNSGIPTGLPGKTPQAPVEERKERAPSTTDMKRVSTAWQEEAFSDHSVLCNAHQHRTASKMKANKDSSGRRKPLSQLYQLHAGGVRDGKKHTQPSIGGDVSQGGENINDKATDHAHRVDPCLVQKNAASITPAPSCRHRFQISSTFYGSHQPPAARRPIRTVDDESASDLDSFIVDEDEGDSINSSDGDSFDGSAKNIEDEAQSDGSGEELRHRKNSFQLDAECGKGAQPRSSIAEPRQRSWRKELKKLMGKYDPRNYSEIDKRSDKGMMASFEQIAAEEARAARIGQAADRREAMKVLMLRRKRRIASRRQNRGTASGAGSSESDTESPGVDDSSDEDDDTEGDDDELEERYGEVETRRTKKRKHAMLARYVRG